MQRLKAKILGFGNVTVAYRFVDDAWHATALQFDVVGTGATKMAAFQQMQELVSSFLLHALRSKNKVAFFNPSDREEWEVSDKDDYRVVVQVADGSAIQEPSLRIEQIRAIEKQVEEFELVPA
jgi:hypothetical protein